jgi:hypothetical protein
MKIINTILTALNFYVSLFQFIRFLCDMQSGFFTTPRKSSRLNNNKLIHHGAAFFEKGPGKKPLGFSIIGGSDCGHIDKAIYVKTIYPKGQSYEMDCLKEGSCNHYSSSFAHILLFLCKK